MLAPRGNSRRARTLFLISMLISAAVRHPIRLSRLVRAIKRRGGSRGGHLYDTLFVSAPILAQRVDVVHFAWIDLAKMCIDLVPLLDCSVVVSCTGSDLLVNPLSHERYQELIHAVFDRADLVCCLSDDLRERALDLGLDPSKVIVNNWGVDAGFFSPVPGERVPSTPEPQTSALRVVSVGHLHWVKGYEYALQALNEARMAGMEFLYEILGRDAGALMSVRTAIRDLELDEHVVLRGDCSRTEVRDALRAADVFMLASLSEGRCTAKLEAMAAGVPVVVTDVGGMGEGLTDGVDSVLVPSRDPKALASALLALAADPARRRKIGAEARKRALIDFGAPAGARLMVEQYQRLIDERSRR